jgi:hypothetical protein
MKKFLSENKDWFFLAVLLAIIFVPMVACQSNSKPDVIKGDKNIRYFHDSRTGLCFAAMNSYVDGYAATSFTNVPCTDKVLAIINGN